MIRFDREECANLEQSLHREWLETNGLGGYASGTITGIHTRRYHGLLMAATKPPGERCLLLSKLEETLIIGEDQFELGANQYAGALHPQGFRYLSEFRLDPFPIFTYEVAGLRLEKRVFLVHGENTVAIEYELTSLTGEYSSACLLEIRPLIAFRDLHQTTHANPVLRPEVAVRPGFASMTPYEGLPTLHFACEPEHLDTKGEWYYRFEYERERERGLDFQEDLFQPFTATFRIAPGQPVRLLASTEERNISDLPRFKAADISRREQLQAAVPGPIPLVRDLAVAADQFLVSRGSDKTIIAGYHWFSDWGRDTMIALPGLTLTTGRSEVAGSILRTFARSVDHGMLPNWFPGAGETPEYNTVDATLWFFEAIRAYLQHTGDAAFVRDELYPVLTEIVDWHVRGTLYGIRVDRDGLLQAGTPGAQLTWMDAKVGDTVITPRHGKPVEIQALWYNALRIMDHLARLFGDGGHQPHYAELASATYQQFLPAFWNEAAGCLYDVVDGSQRDASLRPNQIFAVSLPHSMLPAEKARRVVETVQRELLTPYGLRTLARGDPRYCRRYEGSPAQRDAAYHQGTVWPWLMGPFLTAYVRVHGHAEAARQQAVAWLMPLQEHLCTAGLGQVSEIFDAEPPHTPRGCIAQAWSVAEVLRVLVDFQRQMRKSSE